MSEYDVFVSYAPDDLPWVEDFAGRLERAGLRVALDRWVLGPGDIIVHGLEEAIRSSSHGILVFSRAAEASGQVRQEYAALIGRSAERGQKFIPVVIDDVELPAFARTRVFSDFRGADESEYERLIAALVRAIRGEKPDRESVRLARPRGQGPVTLSLAADRVVLESQAGAAIAHRPAPDLRRLDDLRWKLESRRRVGALMSDGAEGAWVGPMLMEYGRELGTAFLSGPAGEALRGALKEAVRTGSALRLGLRVSDDLADLSWETLILPGEEEPLSLHPRVQLFRSVSAEGVPALALPGPLRILVALATPEEPDSGFVLDLEAELAKILDSVETARKTTRGAYVRVLNDGTLSTIRDALVQERYHILHISCAAEPGVLLLEDEQGRVDRVTTERFVREGIPAERAVPLLVLSGSSTAVSVDESGDAPPLPGMARGLTRAGIPSVLAMTAPVSNRYATAFAGFLYSELALRSIPEALPAFCDARRRLEEARRRAEQGQEGAGLAEWATPALFLSGPSLPLYDPADGIEEIWPAAEPEFADGVPLRSVGEFIGRRSELRALSRALAGTGRGVVLHGIGGVGKSTLAAELLRRNEQGIVASAVSETSPDQILDELGRRLLAAVEDDSIRKIALQIRQPQLDWTERLAILGPVLYKVPVVLLLDNFEDNLARDGDRWEVRSPALGKFLTTWIRLQGKGKLLITSRYPVQLPQRAERRLTSRQLGPLSWPETRKLAWRLPALDALSAEDLLCAWADVGGHPRALEYLDALLRGGQARFDDVRERLEALLERRGVEPERWFQERGPDLDAALAEAVTLTVDDSLLRELLGLLDDFTRDVLTGLSVFRIPVDLLGAAISVNMSPVRSVVITPPGVGRALEVLSGLGLVAVSHPSRQEQPRYLVHRWTAKTLADPTVTEEDRLLTAHRDAADYWHMLARSDLKRDQFAVEALLECRYHHLAIGDLDAAALTGLAASDQLRQRAAWGWAEMLIRDSLPWLPPGSQHLADYTHNLGMILEQRGDYQQALNWFRHSLAIEEKNGNRTGMAISYVSLGRLAERVGDYDQATDWYERSRAICEDTGDRKHLADTYAALGGVAQARGDYAQAEEWYRQSLTIEEEMGDREGVAASLRRLGQVILLRGDHDQAAGLFRRSLAICEELDDQPGIASACHDLGLAAQQQGDYDQALTLYRRALSIHEERGDILGIAGGYHQLSRLAQLRKDYQQALDWSRQAFATFQTCGDHDGLARSHAQIGAILSRLGRLREAVDHTMRALVGLTLSRSPDVLISLWWLGQEREALGDEEFRQILARYMTGSQLETLISQIEQAYSSD
jgi:tetratricopeptide (TPR) repeat protein